MNAPPYVTPVSYRECVFYYGPSFSPQLGSELIGNVDYNSGYVLPK